MLSSIVRPAAVLLIALTALIVSGCGSSQESAAIGGAPCSSSPSVDALQTEGVPSTDEIYRWVEELVGVGYRRSGTEAGYRAAAWVKCQFEALGLEDVHYLRSTTWDWRADDWDLIVEGDRFDAFPVAHSFVTAHEASTFSTGPDGLTAEIVDVRRGTDLNLALDDVEGKIALFDLRFTLPNAVFLAAAEFVYDPRLTLINPPDTLLAANPFINNYQSVVGRLIEAGAVGFIGVLADYFDSNRFHNEFYHRLETTVPGLWVAPEEGARIRRAMDAADGAATATIHMDGSRREAEGRTVIGFLPGRSKDTIQIQSHHDSAFDGAVEDASGVAMVLALARYFAAQPPESREKTLMFTTFDTHFTGYQSHQDFVRTYVTDNQTPYKLVANVTLEHIARQAVNRDGALTLTGEVDPRGIMESVSRPLRGEIIDAVRRHDLERSIVMSADTIGALGNGSLPTDASWIYVAGVPVVSLISGPLYLYDAADTLDKVAREELRPTAQAFVDIVEAIDATPSDSIGR